MIQNYPMMAAISGGGGSGAFETPPVAGGAGGGDGSLAHSKNKFDIAVVQLAIDDASKDARLARVADLLEQTKGATLVMLPELWGAGYFAFDRYATESENLTGPTIRLMQQHAITNGAFVLAGSIVERDGSQLHNTSVLISPEGSIIGSYRKVHLFGYGSDERRLLTPGTEPVVVRTDLGTFGLATCFDLRFPELFRRLLDGGVMMFLVVSAWPHPRLEHWQVLTQARALENQAFLVAANCAGTNRGRLFCGHSVVIDPNGRRLAEAGEEEQILRISVDLDDVDRARENFPSVSSRVLK